MLSCFRTSSAALVRELRYVPDASCDKAFLKCGSSFELHRDAN